MGLNSDAFTLNLKLDVDLAAGFASVAGLEAGVATFAAGALEVAGVSAALAAGSVLISAVSVGCFCFDSPSFLLASIAFSSDFGLSSLSDVGDFFVLESKGTRSGGTGTLSLKV